VIEARSLRALRGSATDEPVIGEMLELGLQQLTGAPTTAQAWRAILGSAKRVVIKFNSVGARVIDTTEPLARRLVDQLAQAGIEPPALTLVEVPGFLVEELRARRPVSGWGKSITVGNRPEPLARYLYEADALINVSFLKTHQIAGMSGCMKNISHAVIRHPAWYHADGCSPYVGQVIGSQEVSSRLRLNIVNAIRVVANRGPEAREADVVPCGALLLGFDPVAVDHIALSALAAERRRLGLNANLSVPHLASAARMGLGRWRRSEIDHMRLDVEG